MEGAVVTNDFWYFDIDQTIIDKDYFLHLTSTSFFDNLCRLASDGTTNRVRLQSNKFYNYEIDLPLIDEQRTALKQLLLTKEKLELLTLELDNQEALLKKLQQAILQDAVQGKLTATWRDEHPVTDDAETGAGLLTRIRAEKAALIAAKKLKKEKPLPPITDAEKPFDVPDSWVWCRLGESSINRDGERQPVAQVDRERRAKIYDYYGASGVIDKIDGFTHNGSYLLIGEDGANLTSRSTPIAFIAKGKFWVNNHAHVIESVNKITLEYLCYYINTIDLKPYVTGGFQPKLSQAMLNIIPIPLPPLAEQQAIVAAVERALAQVGALRAALAEQRETAQTLQRALLHQAFSNGEAIRQL